MSNTLIKIGLTGLNAHQSALNTTGNNVTNANTEGYSRQRVTVESTPSQYRAGGYQGTGVQVANIERITSQFLVTQLRLDASTNAEYNSLLSFVSQVDGLLADSATGLAPSMDNFFKAMQSAADDPSAIPQRTLVVSEAEGLANRFSTVYSRLEQLGQNANQELSSLVSRVNSLSTGIGDLNTAIVVATKNGQAPNELLDERDKMLRQLSEIVSVSAVEQGDGRVNVFIGKGQALVSGSQANRLELANSASDPSRQDIYFVQNGVRSSVSSELSGGKIGGILQFRDNVLPQTLNSVGRLALTLAETVNAQHQLGVDLEGQLGGDFFADINGRQAQLSRVSGNKLNALPADRILSVEITDASRLTTLDYELQFTGPSNGHYAVVDKASGKVMDQGVLSGPLPNEVELDGFRIHLEAGSFQQGDRFMITPTRQGARDITLALERPEQIALGQAVRGEASLSNTGTATLSAGTVLSVQDASGQLLPAFAQPGKLEPPLVVRFLTDNRYEILDNSDPANPKPLDPPLTNQLYTGSTRDLFTADSGQTMVRAFDGAGSVLAQVQTGGANGYPAQNLTLRSRNPDTGALTSTTLPIAADSSAKAIATALNSQAGVQANAYTDATIVPTGAAGMALVINGETLSLDSGMVPTADDFARLINENGALKGAGVYAISDGVRISLRAANGDDLNIGVTGAGSATVQSPNDALGVGLVPGGTATVGGFVDVKLANGQTLAADAAGLFATVPAAHSSYQGFQFSLSGAAKQGDSFTIGYNTDGVSDNRNALAMVGLETAGTLSGGKATYSDSYSQLVESVGTATSQARMNQEASQSLLRQSESSWQSMSGVNLDEEAGKLIQFQAAYNASAKVMGIARELFDTLIATFR